MNPALPRLGAVLAGAALALVVAGPVLADAELVSSTPANGAVLTTPPPVVELTFSAGIDARKSSFRLVGPGGDIGRGAASRDGATTMSLEGLALAPGDYRVRWTAAARDGHITRGSIGFTVIEATPAPPTPSPTATAASSASPAAASATAAATREPSAAPTMPAPSAVASPPAVDGEPAGGSGTDVVLPIVVALALVAVLGGFVLRRGRTA